MSGRDGEVLGALGWRTRELYLSESGKCDLTREERLNMRKGAYVVRKDPIKPGLLPYLRSLL